MKQKSYKGISVDSVKNALALVKEFEGKKITIHSVKVSGEISKLKEMR